MADKQMLQVHGEWIDLSKIIHYWFTRYKDDNGLYYKFNFFLEGLESSLAIRIEAEEKKQFEEKLKEVMQYFCSTWEFIYKPPPPKSTSTSSSTTEKPKPKGYLED